MKLNNNNKKRIQDKEDHNNNKSKKLNVVGNNELFQIRLKLVEFDNTEENVKKQRLDRMENKKKLKSDVKLSTAFVKKVGQINESNAEALAKDVLTKLNLNRYVGEIVNAILKAPLKLKDISKVSIFCSAMHQRYEDFTNLFTEELEEMIEENLSLKTPEKADIVKRRICLRLLGELTIVNVIEHSKPQLLLIR